MVARAGREGSRVKKREGDKGTSLTEVEEEARGEEEMERWPGKGQV